MTKLLDKFWHNMNKKIYVNSINDQGIQQPQDQGQQPQQQQPQASVILSNKIVLFKENFMVIDLMNDDHHCKESISKQDPARKLLKQDRFLALCSNRIRFNDNQMNDLNYFEIIFVREKLYKFSLYHSINYQLINDYYELFRQSINNLARIISLIKTKAFEQLKLIMESLKLNPKWTATHVAARCGFDEFFKESTDICSFEINKQMDDDRMTPLHLAINNCHSSIVQCILDLLPNLNLKDCRQYSCLHSAALSTHEIFVKILYQPDMFNRIQWRNCQGSTALHLACFAQNYSIVFEFLKFGLTVRMLTLPPPKPPKSNPSSSEISIKKKNKRRQRSSTKLATKDQVIVQFTEQDLMDIDLQDIVLAGSPLHWTKHRRLLEKLISYKFKLNIPNMNEDTPLHMMVKRNRLRCVIMLLCSGANVNVRNKFGNTPLHHAVKIDEITLTQTLVVFDADIDVTNKANESPRHLAAKESQFSPQILFVLSSLGAKRCPNDTNIKNCNDGCSESGTFDGKWSPSLIELTKQYECLFRNLKNRKHFENEMMNNDINDRIDQSESNHHDEANQNNVNLLTLDGGGIKGLITIQIMIELQKYLQRPIIDYFKWIAGTSTGSFIVVFLVTGTSLKQIRNIYMQFKDKVFVGERPYDAELLEKLIKNIIGSELKMEDLLLNHNKMVMIPAGLIDRKPMKLHLFRSYESYYELLKIQDFDKGFSRIPSREQLVWQACRASGSAPTYFKTFGPFIDGGLIACNPTLDAMTEIEFRNIALKQLSRDDECHRLKFILSLGTGKQQVEESKAIDIGAYSLRLTELNNQIRYIYQMASLLLNEVCNTDYHIVNRAEAFCAATNKLYFRINPMFDRLIELDETLDFKIINALWETKRFMYLKRNEIEQIANYLERYTYFNDNKIKSSQSSSSMTMEPAAKSSVTAKTISMEKMAENANKSAENKEMIPDSQQQPEQQQH